MKPALLLMAAGIAGSALLANVWAHEGHNHAAQAQHSVDPQGVAQQGLAQQDRQSRSKSESGQYQRSLQVYVVPDVGMVNANARPVRIRELLASDGPVMLNFISAHCATVCRALNREFALVPEKLGAAAANLRMVSVSIHADNDVPKQLKALAEQFGAGKNWQFITGSIDDIETMQRAFDSYDVSQSETKPLTFLRPVAGKPWVRINGVASAEDLAHEFRHPKQN